MSEAETTELPYEIRQVLCVINDHHWCWNPYSGYGPSSYICRRCGEYSNPQFKHPILELATRGLVMEDWNRENFRNLRKQWLDRNRK